ncbi:hypothetical protein GCM10010215_77030 [Streptomyces virginiae]|uniref:DUF465 domain-containing protein n=1 Tax=Streptomyces virginiae TaxID=1961 RepID=A0ABQ3NUQ5_STRVG|nr:DUF6284 family protein [Streptomyces virginiae]MBP2345137.1 hypothetical protein [Streptomyces virginiae]GGQ42087.1 hypothetical protein GCM10010215_77030 [Streptomyces virginiae]GHI16499.1 hypothetical protein Scinn_59620 [Streptomyces virginiae]
MKSIVALQNVVTPWSDGLEPTDAELEAIEIELPLILAERDLLDAQIMTLDRMPTEVDEQRLRRARRRVLAARTALENRAAHLPSSGGAA